MDNKLSELSKPSAEVVSKFGDPEAFGERELRVLTDIQKLAYGTKFYSQEYVSALLAELEAKDKRIANLEFEQGGYGYSVLEDLNGKIKRIAELEAKLATPVRFPDCDTAAVSIMAHWLSDEEVNAWVKGIEFAKQQIRAAGFTVSEE